MNSFIPGLATMANEPIAMQQQLSSCAAQIRDQDNTDEVWPRVEQAAQALANVLRVKDGPGKL